MKANSINEVLQYLDDITSWCNARSSRMGYFASLYRSMTKAVQQGIEQNKFEDGERMERLDVIFANRYLDAWDAYQRNNRPCTNGWRYAFDVCKQTDIIVLQHLILGINTHINLDLGIAAAETSPGNKIFALKQDFNKINDVIAGLTQKVQDALCNVWFPLRAITSLTNNRQDAVINFSIGKARQASWANAVALANAQGQAKINYINLIDNGVVLLGKKISNPGLFLSFLLRPVLRMEKKNVNENISFLQLN
jgi:hypothetical protein